MSIDLARPYDSVPECREALMAERENFDIAVMYLVRDALPTLFDYELSAGISEISAILAIFLLYCLGLLAAALESGRHTDSSTLHIIIFLLKFGLEEVMQI